MMQEAQDQSSEQIAPEKPKREPHPVLRELEDAIGLVFKAYPNHFRTISVAVDWMGEHEDDPSAGLWIAKNGPPETVGEIIHAPRRLLTLVGYQLERAHEVLVAMYRQANTVLEINLKAEELKAMAATIRKIQPPIEVPPSN